MATPEDAGNAPSDGPLVASDAPMDECPHHGEPEGIEAGLAKGGAWEVARPLMLPNAHQRSESIPLEAGTLLRCEHSWAVPNAWVPFPWSILFRFQVLTGPHVGTCVLIETDTSANLSGYGLTNRP